MFRSIFYIQFVFKFRVGVEQVILLNIFSSLACMKFYVNISNFSIKKKNTKPKICIIKTTKHFDEETFI